MKNLFTRLGVAMALFACASTASAQETLVVDGTKGYDGVLVQGADYVLPGTDETWYAMPEYFTHKSGDVWTFNAYPYAEYAYFFELKDNLKWINVEIRQVDDPEATWANWDLNKAIYVNGGTFGFPSHETNNLNWDAADGWAGNNSVAVGQIADGKYRLTLVVGQQISATSINFKFYGQRPFEEGVFWPTRLGGIIDMEENPWLRLNGTNPEETGDSGNIFLKDGAELADGDTIIVSLDMTTTPGKMTVDYREQVMTDFPTFNGQNMDKRGNNYVFDGTLTQGAEFSLGNLGVADVNAADIYVDPIVATKTADGKYRFNAITGNYSAVLYPALNYLKIFPGTYDAPATFADGKALWIIGSNIGQPSVAVNNSNWGASLANSIPVAQIAENVYKIQFTYGQELTGINFKFFGQYGWGTEFHGSDLVLSENDFIYINNPAGEWTYDENGNENYTRGGDDGNIFGTGNPLGNGDVLTLTIDLNGFVAGDPANEIEAVPGKVTVEYEAYAGPVPTLNGEKMTSASDNYYANVHLNTGDVLTLTDPNGLDLDATYSDPFFAASAGNGKFQFNAVSGDYAVVLVEGKNYLKIFPGTYEAPATITDGGLWIIGEGIGRPSVNGDAPGWNTGAMTDVPVAQVEKDVFKMGVTCGQEMWDNWCNYKFFGQADWGIEFKTPGEGVDYALTSDNQYLGVGSGSDGHDDGNIYFKGGDDGVFVNGETYIVTLDFTAGYNAGVLRVEKGDLPTASGIEAIQTVSRLADGAIYNLQGVRVAATVKGLYIQNGRKVVVK